MELQELVRKTIDRNEGDRPKAVEKLFSAIKSDRELWDELAAPAIRVWCEQQVNRMIGSDRRASVSRTTGLPGNGNGRVRALAATNLLNFPLRSGKLLRHATVAEVEADAAAYDRHIAAESVNRDFERLIVKNAKDRSKLIGQQFTEPDLDALMRKAQS